jgi:hypothetical protein
LQRGNPVAACFFDPGGTPRDDAESADASPDTQNGGSDDRQHADHVNLQSGRYIFRQLSGYLSHGCGGVNFSLDNLIMTVGAFLAVGANSFIARLLGAKQDKKARKFFQQLFSRQLSRDCWSRCSGLFSWTRWSEASAQPKISFNTARITPAMFCWRRRLWLRAL